MNIYLIHKVWSFLNILRTGCTALTEFGNQTKRTLLCMSNYGVTHLAVICHQVHCGTHTHAIQVSNTTNTPYPVQFGSLQLLAFPKAKIAIEGQSGYFRATDKIKNIMRYPMFIPESTLQTAFEKQWRVE